VKEAAPDPSAMSTAAGGAPAAAAVPLIPGAWGTIGLDSDVVELCDTFHIDDVHARRLNDIMGHRIATKDADLLRLWTDMEQARNPNALLSARMREMEDGLFAGQCEKDEEMEMICNKYELDEQASLKLSQYICRHPPERRKAYYVELEQHLGAAKKPSATAMTMLKTIRAGEPLGPVTHNFKGFVSSKILEEKAREKAAAEALEKERRDKEQERKDREDGDRPGRDRNYRPRHRSEDRGRGDRGSDRGREGDRDHRGRDGDRDYRDNREGDYRDRGSDRGVDDELLEGLRSYQQRDQDRSRYGGAGAGDSRRDRGYDDRDRRDRGHEDRDRDFEVWERPRR